MQSPTIAIGKHRDSEGRPLVVVDGKILGDVAWLRRLLQEFELAEARRIAVPTPPHLLEPEPYQSTAMTDRIFATASSKVSAVQDAANSMP